MASVLAYLRIPLAIIEMLVWLPASFAGLTLAAAYSVAGNEIPANVLAGFLLVPVTFIVGPLYALSANARAHPWLTLTALTLPPLCLALTWASELLSLTHTAL